jgi:hypothetical protein
MYIRERDNRASCVWSGDTSFSTAQATARDSDCADAAEALLFEIHTPTYFSHCAVGTRNCVSPESQSDSLATGIAGRYHACASPDIRYVSIRQPLPGLGLVDSDPTSHSATSPRPIRVHGIWRTEEA